RDFHVTGVQTCALPILRLDETMAKWAHTFETASWGAAILDPVDWRIESANAAFARMHGEDAPGELVGRLITDFLEPDVVEGVMEVGRATCRERECVRAM